MEPIETLRLVLRDFVDTDWKAMSEYARDPETVKYLPWGPNSEGQTIDFLRKTIEARDAALMSRRDYQFGIVLKEGDRLIGGMRITIQHPEHRNGDIGYVLHRSHWKKGLMTEAGRAILDFGFSKLGLHRIYATCDPANEGSARVLEKIGMKREGHLRDALWMKNDWRDSLLYAILHQDWKAQRAAGV